MKAIQTLFSWLEKGECLKRNSNTFYSMIQSTNSQVRRLLNEKSTYDDEFQRAKDLFRQRMTGLLMQCKWGNLIHTRNTKKNLWGKFSFFQIISLFNIVSLAFSVCDLLCYLSLLNPFCTVSQIEKVFSAACQRKVWDHFSKAQRKNIEVWKKQAAVSYSSIFMPIPVQTSFHFILTIRIKERNKNT